MGIMCIAVFMGVVGYCCATFLAVLGGYGMMEVYKGNLVPKGLLAVMLGIAFTRGIFHYIEQYCNHYIAFRLLALIRDKVFTVLRKLAPAKLDGKEKGNLISLITSDIELLEVFYAHTLSPICIAVITSTIVIGFLSRFHLLLGGILLISHVIVGVVIPIITSKSSRESGEVYRKEVGTLNTYVLDSLRGMGEVLQYDSVGKRWKEMSRLSKKIEQTNEVIKGSMGITSMVTTGVILITAIFMLITSAHLANQQVIEQSAVIISVIMSLSSFGSVIAVANLGTGLTQTIASGARVLELLEEQPMVEEVTSGSDVVFQEAQFDSVTFSYAEWGQEILKDFSLTIPKNTIIGITGKSGCGKSTLLKLLMRFFEVQEGKITISNENVNLINTKSLRKNQSLVSQETHLFHDTIENNLKIANQEASEEEIIEACKKASIHEFIQTLPQGYQTQVGELGDTLSGGEKQRIGVARAFLHQAPLILLDEPTSNLDSLNEGVILKALQEYTDATIVLVSHRKSTMNIASTICNVENGRVS